MRVLVTGGLGFIGSSLAEHYCARGHDVLVIDNHANPVVTADQLPRRAHHVKATVEEYAASWYRHRFRADVIVHCASPVGPAGILGLRGQIATRILADTASIIRLATAHDAHLINISTSEVYGTSGVYKESDDLRVPAVPSARIEYALGKIAAEAECRLTPGLRSVNIRPFNVAGARQSRKGGFVLPTFAEQAVTGLPITVYEDGSQQRALTSVDDLARFITDHAHKISDGSPINVGNPSNITTITELAHRVAVRAGAPPALAYTTGKAVHGPDYAEAEGHTKIPDITRARALGWEPRVGLDQLVDQAISHARTRLAAAA